MIILFNIPHICLTLICFLPSRGHGTYKRAVGAGEEYGDSSTLRVGESLNSGGNNNSSHHNHVGRGHRRTQSGSASEVTEQLADAMASMDVPPASEDVRRR